MLMKPDKKNMVSVIMSGMNKKDEPAPMSEDMGLDDSSIALESAAEEIIAAIHDKNPKALVEAMKSYHDLCDMETDTTETEG